MFEGEFRSVTALAAVRDGLACLDQGVEDAVRVERLRVLEEIKSAACAAQAREVVAFAASQRRAQLAAGVPAERADRGIAAQVGLAMRKSPWYAARFVGWCRVLTSELTETFTALSSGRVSEQRAVIVAKETIWLSREDRTAVDSEIAPRLEGLGDKKLEAAVKRIAYRLDPDGYVARSAAAVNDRRVWIRPAPDAMARVTALLPIAQGVACYASLTRAADTSVAGGDERGRGQIMADTFVQRVTGQASADAVPVEVHLVMTDRALLDPTGPGGDEPAVLEAGEPLPAELARSLVLDGPDETPMWLRRMYLSPGGRGLAAAESTRRLFTAEQRRFVRLRDQRCRTPWCDAPIRHTDHVRPAADGGPTSIDNAQGYCEACNHAQQAPGWRREVGSRAGPHEVLITTPTGQRYRSRAPDPPRAA